jgi:hypothetical protein
VPRSIRPSAASGLGRGGRPGSVDRRSFASGLESRVPWRGGASLAGRSASSRLRAILSMRPRGPPLVVGRFPTPRGTRTRRAHESAWRVDVRESIWTPAIECQTSQCDRSALPSRDTPQGYSDSLVWGALRGRLARCYPSRAPDAGTLAGTFGGPPEEQVERSNPAPHSGVRGPRTLAPSWSVYRLSQGRGVGDSFTPSRQSTI